MPPPVRRIDRRAIDRLFERRIADRGRALVRAGAVKAIAWSEDEALLCAVVQGSEPEPYELEVAVDAPDLFAGECDCPYGSDCKHAAAALFVLADHLEGEPTGRTTVVTDGPEALDEAFDEMPGAPLGGSPDRAGGGAGQRAPEVASARSAAWLEGFVRARTPDTRGPLRIDGPTDRAERWFYRIGRDEDGAMLSVVSARPLQKGGFGRGTLYRVGRGYGHADVLRSVEDVEILALCEAELRGPGRVDRYWDHDGVHRLRGRTGALLLDLAIATGRARLDGEPGAVLSTGPERPLDVRWERTENEPASLRLALSVGPGDADPGEDGAGTDATAWRIPTDPPRYLDPVRLHVGPLATALGGQALALLERTPPVRTDLAPRLSRALVATLGDPGIPLPAPVDVRTIDEVPARLLVLHSPGGGEHVDGWALTPLVQYGADHVFGLHAHIVDRGAEVVPAEDDEEVLVRVHRHHDLEREWYDEFVGLFPRFAPCSRAHDPHATPAFLIADHRPAAASSAAAFEAFREVVRAREALAAEGWTLQVAEPVNVRTVTVSSFDAELAADGAGWFDLALGVEHDGRRYDLLALVVDWLEQDDPEAPLLTRTESGEWLEVPAALLGPVARTLADLGERDDGRVRLSRARALSLETLSREIEATGVPGRWRGADAVFGLARKLEALANSGDPAAGTTGKGPRIARAPRTLKAEMRPYQLAGLAWLEALADAGLNGVLADDMGLGKTLQTLAHVLARRAKRALDGPVLVIAPTSLLGNWAREAARFAPVLGVRVWHGTDRHARPLEDDTSDLVITSYALALRDAPRIAARGFALLVLDEAQVIRNPDAKISKAVRALPIERRLCLTGTPLENHLGELWSLFDFLMPGLLGDRARFTHHFRTPIEKRGDADRQQRLAGAIRPFLLRRKKEDVAAELPPKTEMVREVALEGAQAALYETIRVAMQVRVRELLERRGLAKSRIEMLDALLKLRQVCCHPSLLKTPAGRRVTASAKTTLALSMIGELVAEGRRILVFSQFTEMLAILENGLAERGISHVKLTGRTRRRDAVVDAFQRGDVPVFLISLKAGGTGLNLTAADTVIHYDPWWNPAAENQASDRAHRIGQDKPVFVYKLVAGGTIEERIVEMQVRKRALSDATIERDAAGAGAAFTAEDVLSLFDAP